MPTVVLRLLAGRQCYYQLLLRRSVQGSVRYSTNHNQLYLIFDCKYFCQAIVIVMKILKIGLYKKIF